MPQKWYQNKLLIFFAGIGAVSIPIIAVIVATQFFSSPSASDTNKQIVSASPSVSSPKSLSRPEAPSFKSSNSVTSSNKFNLPQATCGDKPTGGDDVWYPVFINGGNLEDIRNQYCADAVSTIRQDTKVQTVQVASFTNRNKALEFAQAVGGDVGQPTNPKTFNTPTKSNSSSNSHVETSKVPTPTDSEPTSTASNSSIPLTLNAFHWYEDAGYIHYEGQVTNNSDRPIRSLQAIAEFYSPDGQFITSDTTYMTINPLMPGQTSPFKSLLASNPQMNKLHIRFKTFEGEISYNKSLK